MRIFLHHTVRDDTAEPECFKPSVQLWRVSDPGGFELICGRVKKIFKFHLSYSSNVFLYRLYVEIRRRIHCVAGPDLDPVTLEEGPTILHGHACLRKYLAMPVRGGRNHVVLAAHRPVFAVRERFVFHSGHFMRGATPSRTRAIAKMVMSTTAAAFIFSCSRLFEHRRSILRAQHQIWHGREHFSHELELDA
ncbi:hypothetical protein BGV60_33120 [Burkholderia ubonensis]|nr:hypothetical protein BGV60_33120 [Burkholderia ubonensis]OJB44853.1 hypothetical protein BGV59_25720 [Burkholderia ubonensis]